MCGRRLSRGLRIGETGCESCCVFGRRLSGVRHVGETNMKRMGTIMCLYAKALVGTVSETD